MKNENNEMALDIYISSKLVWFACNLDTHVFVREKVILRLACE